MLPPLSRTCGFFVGTVILETSQDRKQLMITAFDPVKGRSKVLRTIEQHPSHTCLRFREATNAHTTQPWDVT